MRTALLPVAMVMAAMVMAAMVGGCGKAPPATQSFDGNALKLARNGTLASGERQVIYTDDGSDDGVPDAKHALILTVATDTKPAALERSLFDTVHNRMSLDLWLMREVSTQPEPQPGTTACYVARNVQNGRFWVSLMSCRTVHAGKQTVCASWDEVVPMPCNSSDTDCRDAKAKALCTGRIDDETAPLVAALDAAARAAIH